VTNAGPHGIKRKVAQFHRHASRCGGGVTTRAPRPRRRPALPPRWRWTCAQHLITKTSETQGTKRRDTPELMGAWQARLRTGTRCGTFRHTLG
jgi:hypothetical protein